jgi:hypothetical protein
LWKTTVNFQDKDEEKKKKSQIKASQPLLNNLHGQYAKYIEDFDLDAFLQQ